MKIGSPSENKLFPNSSVLEVSTSLNKSITCPGQSPELLSEGLGNHGGTTDLRASFQPLSPEAPGAPRSGGKHARPEGSRGTRHRHTPGQGPRLLEQVLFLPLQHFPEHGMQVTGI